MDGGRDEDDATTCTSRIRSFTVGIVLAGRCDEMWESCFQRIIGAQDVDVYNGFEGVGTELIDGC